MKTLVLTMALACLAVGTAHAQAALAMPVACMPSDKLVALLKEKYHEELTGFGLDTSNALMQVFTSPQHTFTILARSPSGISCIFSAGKNWENQAPEIAGDKT